jgi:hypothetical protein
MAIKDYRGKYFSIYGDSLSTLCGYNPVGYDVYYKLDVCDKSDVFDYSDTWWGQVIERLGGKLLKNNSWSGCCVTDPLNFNVEHCGCAEGRLRGLCDGDIMPGVIIVFMGTNDRGREMPFDGDEDSITNFCGAYSYMLKRLKELYPTAEIWCMTFRRQDIYDPEKGNSVDSYSQAVRERADKFGCKLIDLFNYPPYAVYDANIHPDKQGMKDIAEIVFKEVERNF